MDGAPVGRRMFLGMLGLGAAGVVFGARVQDAMERVLAPVTARDGTGLASILPTGRFRIYSVVGFLPSRSRRDYRLRVGERTFTFAELAALPQVAITKDFQCVTGWRVRGARWRGARLRDVLDAGGVDANAAAVVFGSFDGEYTESLTMRQARRDDVWVVWELEGKPLSRAHGGPVRLLVGPMYGYKSLKWLDTIDAAETPVPGYWEQRGYDQDAWVGRSNGRDDEPT